MADIISKLEDTISQRRKSSAGESYVAKLTAQGRAKMAQKLGEEGVEAVIAAMADDRENMVGEAADLVFHLLVLLADMDLSWEDICKELERREGVSGLVEKGLRNVK